MFSCVEEGRATAQQVFLLKSFVFALHHALTIIMAAFNHEHQSSKWVY
jgi:hypothetical protein